MVRIIAGCLAVLCFYALFYRIIVKRWGKLVQPILDRSSLAANYPLRQVEAVGKLAAAGVAQALFALLLMLIVGIGPRFVFSPTLRVDLILLGAGVGLGELVFSSFLCTIAVHLALLRASDARAERERDWLVQSRGGWMGLFSATVRAAPPWFAMASLCLYVIVEELIFRGLLIELLWGAGAGWAVVVSAGLFVVVQSFNMPSARAAIFPMLGALVVGVTHGVLYWHVPDVLPLMVAHLTFFVGALGMWRRDDLTTVAY